MPPTQPIPCFRGGAPPPPLRTLEERLKRPFRIRCRDHNGLARAAETSEHLALLLQNEKRTERALRSKSGWDCIFEIAPMAPWRETSTLHKTPEEPGTILYLDFKNFYPAIICSMMFPHPARLMLEEKPDLGSFTQENPPCGLFRTILHPCERTPGSLRHHHPFQMTHGHKTLPVLIQERPIETFLHGPEVPIWKQWFDLEITEGLISLPISHPLANATRSALEVLQKENPDPEERERKKLLINVASTTPKLMSPKTLPSPFGVHCLPAQIAAMARTLLCQTSQIILGENPDDRILAANTDGMLVLSQNPERTLASLAPLLGDEPGQLREKARGDEAVIAGPNLWWLLNQNQLQAASGRGRDAKPEENPVPLHYRYGANLENKIASVHLADFRHHLDHQTLTRTKVEAPTDPGQIPRLIQTEKRRSLLPTLRSIRTLRKRLAPGPNPNTP